MENQFYKMTKLIVYGMNQVSRIDIVVGVVIGKLLFNLMTAFDI